MTFTVGTVQGTLPRLMAGRTMSNADMADWIRKAVLELTEDYMFPELQVSGPQVNFTIGKAGPYDIDFFQVDPSVVKKINSFFVFYNGYTVPLTSSDGINPGYPLKYKTIDAMEMEINTLGLPIHWTRHEGLFYFGFAPNQAYPTYLRYQRQNPFSSPPQSSDVIYMPDSWQDIVEYASAQRAANELRLFDLAETYHTAVFGDPLFQRSGGTEGCPGLIFKRTSQEQRDQTTSTKQMRVITRSSMRK